MIGVRRVFHSLIRITILVGLLSACAGRAALPERSVQATTDAAATKMAALRSLHFVADLTGALAYIDAEQIFALKHVEGDLAMPDRVKATLRTRTIGQTIETAVVGVGQTQFARNPVSGRWEALPPEYGTFDLGALFSPEVGITALLKSATFRNEAVETLDGRAHYVISATTPGADLARMTSGMIRDGNVQATLWIDGETSAVTQIRLIETDSDTDDPTTWLIKLSAFDQPVEIVLPAS